MRCPICEVSYLGEYPIFRRHVKRCDHFNGCFSGQFSYQLFFMFRVKGDMGYYAIPYVISLQLASSFKQRR